MKFTHLKFVAAVAAAAFSLSAQAECAYPKAPASIPNGATATEAEMVAAMQAFKQYDTDVKAFGECLEQETKGQGCRHGAADAAEDDADQEAQRGGGRVAGEGQGVQRAGSYVQGQERLNLVRVA